MSKRIANKKMAEEAKKIKIDSENIEFYEFHENRIKEEEASVDADSTDGVTIDIVSKIVVKIRSLINLKGEAKKEKEEGMKHKKPNFLEVIVNFFHSFFNRTKETQWQEQGKE